jgi:3-oxoacyl-[acyl-carrier-protein] synthase-3
MGAVICSTGISTDKQVKSSVQHAIIAGKACIEQVGIKAEDIDFIINTGIYRENNMLEPAIAMFIQKGLGINNDYVKNGNGKAAFGLDLMNGGIGALNAMRIADSLLQSGAIRYALILGGDSHPSSQTVAGFPYAAIGSALLLSKNTNPKLGFQHFSFRSMQHAQQGREGFLNVRGMGIEGRRTLSIESAHDYVPAARDLAVRLAKETLAASKVAPSQFKVISSQLSASFSKDIADDLEIPSESAMHLFEKYGDIHSATFGLGYHQLQTSKQASAHSHVLFVGAAPGLDAGVIHYVC